MTNSSVDDIYVSFSDVEAFLRCRQKWDFSSSNRQGIRHKVTPKLYLSLGSAVHKALEANLRGQDPLEACRAYLDAERTAKTDAYTEAIGSKPWPKEMAEFEENADLAMALVGQYFDHYNVANPLDDQGLEHIGIEVPFKIDISDWFPNIWNKVYFVGTLDGIAVDEHDGIFVVENKTYSRKLSPEDIQWHWQSQGYAVALGWLTGMPVTGGLYNGIAKKVIKEPKVLKNELLSVDKGQSTTLERYLAAIDANGEAVDDGRFVDILSHLRDLDTQGDTRFFYREKFFFSTEQLDAWQNDFLTIVKEMVGNPYIYRTIPFSGCGDCWFRDLCETKHSGGDLDYLMEKRYIKNSDYGTIEAVKGVEPTVITSVADLREYLKNG